MRERLLKLSKDYKLSHVGSCLTALPILSTIFQYKQDDDLVVLSSGHSGLALYVVLESMYGENAETLWNKHGTHPNRDVYIPASAGSLGHGLGMACGIALSYPDIHVSVVTTDGELREGSMWEAIRIIADRNITNITMFINANGYGAYDPIQNDTYIAQLQSFGWGVLPVTHKELAREHIGLKTGYPLAVLVDTTDIIQNLPFPGLDAHYAIMNDKEYEEITKK